MVLHGENIQTRVWHGKRFETLLFRKKPIAHVITSSRAFWVWETVWEGAGPFSIRLVLMGLDLAWVWPASPEQTARNFNCRLSVRWHPHPHPDRKAKVLPREKKIKLNTKKGSWVRYREWTIIPVPRRVALYSDDCSVARGSVAELRGYKAAVPADWRQGEKKTY